MKKNVLLTSLIVALLTLTSTKLFAQENVFSLGGGLTYITEYESTGIYAKGVYQFNNRWAGAFTGTYYFEDAVTFLGFDADAHYAFYYNEEKLSVYGLFGLNLLTVSSEYFDSESALRVNLGVGLHYQLSEKISLVPELKYVVGSNEYVNYLAASIGLSFSF